jgi:hypothetical protein
MVTGFTRADFCRHTNDIGVIPASNIQLFWNLQLARPHICTNLVCIGSTKGQPCVCPTQRLDRAATPTAIQPLWLLRANKNQGDGITLRQRSIVYGVQTCGQYWLGTGFSPGSIDLCTNHAVAMSCYSNLQPMPHRY